MARADETNMGRSSREPIRSASEGLRPGSGRRPAPAAGDVLHPPATSMWNDHSGDEEPS